VVGVEALGQTEEAMSTQLPAPLPKNSTGESERRRSTRVLLVIPVEVAWTSREGQGCTEKAETEVVSQHGAMLRMPTRLAPGTKLRIDRQANRQSCEARVVGVGNPSPDGLARVAVEMTVPSDTFWGVSFPPMTLAPPPAKPLPLSAKTAPASRPGLGAPALARSR